MIRSAPPLALALAARAASVLPAPPPLEDLASALLPAVAALDAADRAYRSEIERLLPAAAARDVLATMADFRRAVLRVRERAEREIGELFARSGRTRPPFDPLDTYTPSPAGLPHLDGVRCADLADRARAEVAALRSEANARIAGSLAGRLDDLVAAKARRNRDFAGALHAAVTPLARGGEVSPLVEALAGVADGWY